MRMIFQKLSSSDQTYYIKPDAQGNDRFDPSTGTVYWDPTSALRTTESGTQSPALGLGHELAHAEGYDYDEDRFRDLGSTPIPDYDDAEEQRVITGPETSAALTLHENTRCNHRAQSLPTVTKPTDR